MDGGRPVRGVRPALPWDRGQAAGFALRWRNATLARRWERALLRRPRRDPDGATAVGGDRIRRRRYAPGHSRRSVRAAQGIALPDESADRHLHPVRRRSALPRDALAISAQEADHRGGGLAVRPGALADGSTLVAFGDAGAPSSARPRIRAPAALPHETRGNAILRACARRLTRSHNADG